MSTLPSAVALTLPIGLLIATLPLSSTEMPTPGAWMETGESGEVFEPEDGVDGLGGVDASEDGAGGWLGADGESELVAGSAWVPMRRGM